MFYDIDRTNAPVTNSKQAKPDKQKEPGIPAVIATLACVLSVGMSGYISLVLTDPDQGKLVSMAEMSVRMTREVERIKNDPHMPPQAKRMALGAIERSQAMGRTINGSH